MPLSITANSSIDGSASVPSIDFAGRDGTPLSMGELFDRWLCFDPLNRFCRKGWDTAVNGGGLSSAVTKDELFDGWLCFGGGLCCSIYSIQAKRTNEKVERIVNGFG